MSSNRTFSVKRSSTRSGNDAGMITKVAVNYFMVREPEAYICRNLFFPEKYNGIR